MASISNASADGEGESLDRDPVSRSTAVDLLALVRQAMHDTGWKQEALSVAMEKDPGYVSKVLGGDKPLGAAFLMALPGDVAAQFSRLHAEAHGLIVVAPIRGDEAIRMLAAGLFGMLAERALPVRSGPPLKATLAAKAAKRSA